MQLSVFFPQLVLFGDSIVEQSVQTPRGIIPQLQNRTVGKYDIVNRGFSGYTTFDGQQIAEAVLNGLGDAPTEWVILAFGTDDLLSQNAQFFDATDLLEITDTALENARNIVIVGPGIVNEDLVNATNLEFFEYGQIAKGVAQFFNVPYIDLWSVFRTFLNENPYLYLNSSLTGNSPPSDSSPESISQQPGANVTFNDSVNQSAFNISTIYANGTNTTNSTNITTNGTNLGSGIVCVFTQGNVSVGVSNGTNGTDCSEDFYTYIGEKGNPKNFLLGSILTDGAHYTDLAYELWFDALLSVLNVTASKPALPPYQSINSTEVLPSAIVGDYISAAVDSVAEYQRDNASSSA